MTRAFVIVNPAAGGGRTGRLWPSLRDDLLRLGLTFDFALTAAPGEATGLARAVVSAYRLVVAVGGDGTLNEVVNGIWGAKTGPPSPPTLGSAPAEPWRSSMPPTLGSAPAEPWRSSMPPTLGSGPGGPAEPWRSSMPPTLGSAPAEPWRSSMPALGAILTGRGRDACRNLGIAREPRLAARRVVEGRERIVDVGVAQWAGGERRYFVGAAGAGFDAAVARRAAALPGSGTVPYLLAVMKSIRAHVPVDVEITVDGGVPWRGAVTAAVIANGSHYGGGMRIAPDADPADGALDLVVLGALSRVEMLRWLPTLYRGTHLRHPNVWTQRVRRVTVSSLTALPTHLDGESTADTPVTLSVCPGALRLRA